MRRRNAAIAAVTLSATAFLVGRGWWKPAVNEAPRQEPAGAVAPQAQGSPAPGPTSSATAIPEALNSRLRVGDEFQFVKTVEQTVTQQGSGGATSRSSLELVMNLRVEEIRDRSRRVRVRYGRVRYAQDIAAVRLDFDSESTLGEVPVAARAYQGLVNNGFDLWLGPDNRPTGVEGFDNFLKRCVRDIPGDDRQAFSTALVGMSHDDSIANFIDESIGLLPSTTGSNGETDGLRIGSQWEQHRKISGPCPLLLTNACTLMAIDERSATVEIIGKIHPASAWEVTAAGGHDPDVAVRGGRTFGYCTIQRDSGLPFESRMERTLEMVVRMPDGTSVEQQKQVLTAIRALPNDASPGSSSPSPITAAGTAPPPPIEDAVINTSHEKDVGPAPAVP